MCVCVSVSEMAGEVLLASVLFLSATVSCFAVYSSGECFFNTKGEHIHTLNLIRKRISYTVYVLISFSCVLVRDTIFVLILLLIFQKSL